MNKEEEVQDLNQLKRPLNKEKDIGNISPIIKELSGERWLIEKQKEIEDLIQEKHEILIKEQEKLIQNNYKKFLNKVNAIEKNILFTMGIFFSFFLTLSVTLGFYEWIAKAESFQKAFLIGILTYLGTLLIVRTLIKCIKDLHNINE